MLFGGDSPTPGLIGIARLASQGEVLEAKRTVRYLTIDTRSALNKVRPGMPFNWSLNPYRGCEFGCRYCYARYTHEFMELRDSDEFETRIFAKQNIDALLARELARLGPGEQIALGTATDPYQPAERRFRRTRALLEVFARNQSLAISITTKSDLIARDIPLLRRVAERNHLTVNITITTLDAGLARVLEPRAPRPDLRLATVRLLSEAGIAVGVFPNPVMPLITDQEPRLSALAKAARDHGAAWFGGGVLFLQPSARRVFFPFVEKHYPALLRRYRERYESEAYLRGPYVELVRERLARIRKMYGLAASQPPAPTGPASEAQPLLFPVTGAAELRCA